MQELYKKLKKYNLIDAIEFEEEDRQFIALKNLWKKGNIDKTVYLSLIITNSIICYQLSGKGEEYWEEFSQKVGKINGKINILDFFQDFLVNSKNNKRVVKVKLKRIEKLLPFFDDFLGKEEKYYENMLKLRDKIAEIMKQKKDTKTIVFAVKMFSYGARNCFNKLVYFPRDINIPVDSRLIKIFEKFKGNYSDINKFYEDLSEKLGIPKLHFDAILWNSRNLY